MFKVQGGCLIVISNSNEVCFSYTAKPLEVPICIEDMNEIWMKNLCETMTNFMFAHKKKFVKSYKFNFITQPIQFSSSLIKENGCHVFALTEKFDWKYYVSFKLGNQNFHKIEKKPLFHCVQISQK